MNGIRSWAAALAVTAALGIWGVAEAQPVVTAEVILVKAPAEVVPRGQTAARPLVKGARLAEGDRVRTGRDGAVELRLGDGSLVRLAELSELDIDRLDVDTAGAPTTSRFNLAAGQARAWVARQLIARVAAAQGAFSVQTTTAVAAVRQTDFAVIHDPNAVTRVYTFEGAVETTSRAGGAVLCARNRWTLVRPGQPPEPCGTIPLRDRRSVLKALALRAVSLPTADPDRAAEATIGAKLSDEKLTGARATGGGATIAPGVPTGTGRGPVTEGTVNIVVTTD
ncbi:MAG TPA: FecR family protein [Methylomirabilota bacterium]|jgi:hypothetical protein|nr:FecR family protein [Methylomirabilota bacterium]